MLVAQQHSNVDADKLDFVDAKEIFGRDCCDIGEGVAARIKCARVDFESDVILQAKAVGNDETVEATSE